MLFTEDLKRQIFAPTGKRTAVANAIIVERSTKKTNPITLKPTAVPGTAKEQKPKPE
ncbi:MAG: hypothetical protein ACXVZX_07305 [Terriglobales bacterium]